MYKKVHHTGDKDVYEEGKYIIYRTPLKKGLMDKKTVDAFIAIEIRRGESVPEGYPVDNLPSGLRENRFRIFPDGIVVSDSVFPLIDYLPGSLILALSKVDKELTYKVIDYVNNHRVKERLLPVPKGTLKIVIDDYLSGRNGKKTLGKRIDEILRSKKYEKNR